jgi:hypothetical protein
VKDTGGMNAGRSASLQSAEQNAQHIDDEYGGHPESRARISAYEIRIEDAEDDRDPKEIEQEKYGDRTNNFDLFGGAPTEPVPSVAPAPSPARTAEDEEATSFASHAAAFTESPVTPELNALEILQLEGIRDKKVREIALEVPYPRMTEETVKKIRDIVEEHAGDIPLTITITDLPEELRSNGEVRLKVAHHFRVTPDATLRQALQAVHANPKYIF